MKNVARGYAVVLVTCASRREARRIARSVVTLRLAACVNVVDAPVRSLYRWKGKMEESREILLVMKSSRARLPALEAEVKRLHSYEVPEFIALPIVAGSEKYLAWVGDCVDSARRKRDSSTPRRPSRRSGTTK